MGTFVYATTFARNKKFLQLSLSSGSVLLCGSAHLVWLTEDGFLYTVSGVSAPKASRPSTPAAAGLILERAGDVLSFTLNNPEHGNKVTGPMFDAMLAELRAEAKRPQARVLRIRARGDVFCTGRERAGRDAAGIGREGRRLIEVKRRLRTSPLISVAEVQGDAFGFGFGLAIVCDFVLVAEHAALGFPEMRSGLPPSAIMAYLGEYTLPRFAFPLVLLGDAITPAYAQQIGLISQVCPAERLALDADALVKRILRLDADAVRRCKEFFLAAQQNGFSENCRLAAEVLTRDSLAVLKKAQ